MGIPSKLSDLVGQLNEARSLNKSMPAAKFSRDQDLPKAQYGESFVGHSASHTHSGRLRQLKNAIPNIDKIAQIASQGKVGKGLETDLVECDRQGVGIWTYVQLPGGKASDGLIKQATGMEGDEVRAALKSLGYAFYRPGQCWRTRCNGTPAIGKVARATHAYRHALNMDDDR